MQPLDEEVRPGDDVKLELIAPQMCRQRTVVYRRGQHEVQVATHDQHRHRRRHFDYGRVPVELRLVLWARKECRLSGRIGRNEPVRRHQSLPGTDQKRLERRPRQTGLGDGGCELSACRLQGFREGSNEFQLARDRPVSQ